MMRIRTSVYVVSVLALAGAAAAQPTNMNLFIQQVGGSSWNWQSGGQPGTWTQSTNDPNQWTNVGQVATSGFRAEWNLSLDPDPFVSNNFALTNNSPVTQSFVVTVILPVAPVLPAFTSTFGSVSGTVGDTSFDSFAQVTSVAPNPIYMALIDGGNYQPLLADPFSATTLPIAGDTQPFGPASFNFPGGQPGVNATIGIRNQFTLTPGDSITLVSTFRIIPTPGTAALLVIGGLAATRRRR